MKINTSNSVDETIAFAASLTPIKPTKRPTKKNPPSDKTSSATKRFGEDPADTSRRVAEKNRERLAERIREALDPVGKEDDDIDNDGEKNTESDKYLKKRRNKIRQAIEDECEECGKSPCECEDEDDDVKEEKNVHGHIEIPSGDLKKLVKRAVKNIDSDVDGDVDKNDPNAGDFGEFVPSVDGKKRIHTKIAKESYSNWREDLVEITNLLEVKNKTKATKITGEGVNNTAVINLSPELKESVEEMGGVLLENYEIDCEPQDIFEGMLDAEIYLLDDYTINYVVENVIHELLDEGYELDYIVDSINESVDHSLFVLNEATAADTRLGARAHNRAAARAAAQNTRLNRKTDRLGKIKSAVKNVVKGISYGTGYAAGAGVRAAKGAAKLAAKGAGYAAGAGVRAAKGVGSQLAKGYEAGRKKNQTQSTQDSPQALSGSQTSASGRYRYVRQEPKQKNIAQRLGDSLRRLVARGARATARGARNLARAVDVKEDFILESIDIASQYFYEQGLNEYGVEILIDEIGEELFCEWVFDITNDSLLIERKLRTGETALPAKTRERITKKPVSRKSVSDLKGGPAATKERSDKARREARSASRQTSEPTERQQRLADLLAAQRKRNVENAKSKQPKTTSTPTETKTGIESTIGSAVKNTAARAALSAWQGHKAAMKKKKEGGTLGQQLGAGAGKALGSFFRKGTSHLKNHVEFGDWLSHIVNEGFDISEWTISELYNEYEILAEKAESEQQQKLFGLALSVKRGQTPRSEVSAEVLKIVDSMSEKEIRKYAKTKHEGIPKKVQQEQASPEDVALARSGKIGRAADQMQQDINDVLSGKKKTFGEPEKKKSAKRVRPQFTDMSNNTTQGRTTRGSRLINADMSQDFSMGQNEPQNEPQNQSQKKKIKTAKIAELRARLAAAMKDVY